MSEPRVAALDFIELGVSDAGAWQTFAEDVLGLASEPSGEALLLYMDDGAWRLKVVETGEDDVRALGFRVTDSAVDAIGERLAALGVELSVAAEREGRGVDALWHCRDPDGLRIELFAGARPAHGAFVSPQGVQGFVTGDQGFGHLVLMMRDGDRADAFYQRGLGMAVSDYVLLGPPGRQLELTFLHCNARHHTVAYLAAPAPKRLNHLMLQTVELDDVGRALDRALAAGVPITASLGRHTNDRMTSFYMRTPSGFDVEFGWGGIEVDEATWNVTTHHAASIWGHRRAPPAG